MENGIHYNGPHQAHRTTGQPARRRPAQAGVLHPFGYPPLKHVFTPGYPAWP